jgi:hypothetical protein
LALIPSSILNQGIKQDGFASIQQHIRTRLTAPFSSTSTDPRYISYCYDVMSNMAATHIDTRMIINRGLSVGEDKCGGLGVHGSGDTYFL